MLIVAYELDRGVVLGALVGLAGAWLLRRVALPASGLYPITVLAIAAFSYSGTAALHASGFAAVYVTALMLGNAELPHRATTRSFAEGLRLAGPDRALHHARPAGVAGHHRDGAKSSTAS